MPRYGFGARWILIFLVNGIKYAMMSHSPCSRESVVVYSAFFVTNWTRELFPKQYPEWRPPAQWSKVVGVSHNENFRLFQVGADASPELKMFAETGKQELLGRANTSNQILDEFLLPDIKIGSGVSSADFFVDSNHSTVSLAARIVPSPDWFVGIDSLNLCAEGHWIDSITVEASPMDAGTDSGFTFTAPNWATEPQEAIYKITSQYPRHPANSFYYPNLTDLPPIATFHIKKKKIYRYETIENEPSVTVRSSPQPDMSSIAPVVIIANADEESNFVLQKTIKRKARKKKRSKSGRLNKECLVGDWSDWTACNAPCGQSIRKRKVTRPGLRCPPLIQERTCGCTKYIFNW